MRLLSYTLLILILVLSCSHQKYEPTTDNGKWLILKKSDLAAGPYHTRHLELFGKYVKGYNRFILKGIDKVQSTAPDGGGYFIGKDSIPTESPIGYELKLLGRSLLDPPRTTSYCSGSSYGAFIEGLNSLYAGTDKKLGDLQYEALRMQEPDGGRREDHVKFWGEWNADGYGNHFALVQYSGMGEQIEPNRARPGDFLNISWKSGLGHSVVFLGWYKNEQGKKQLLYWSSQRSTNGYADQLVDLDRIREVLVVRLTHPERLFTFQPGKTVKTEIPGNKITW